MWYSSVRFTYNVKLKYVQTAHLFWTWFFLALCFPFRLSECVQDDLSFCTVTQRKHYWVCSMNLKIVLIIYFHFNYFMDFWFWSQWCDAFDSLTCSQRFLLDWTFSRFSTEFLSPYFRILPVQQWSSSMLKIVHHVGW